MVGPTLENFRKVSKKEKAPFYIATKATTLGNLGMISDTAKDLTRSPIENRTLEHGEKIWYERFFLFFYMLIASADHSYHSIMALAN
jgi:hypothetical protein